MEIVVDAKNKPLGRVASETALLLQGKNSPKYLPYLEGKTKVVIINASKIKFSGKKYKKKKYYWHTSYLGSLKERKLYELFEKDPKKVILLAIKGMLPKNKLRDKRLKRIEIKL